MLPIGDQNTSRKTTPIVTFIFIILNFIGFYLELVNGEAFIERWAFVPNRFLANPSGEFVTLFTSMFMHAGWMHLGGNMLYLWIFGDNVEDRFGHIKFIIFYLLSGIVAAFAQMALSGGSDVPFLGASGAIAGVLGAYILMYPINKVRVLLGLWVIHLPAVIVIGVWFLIQFFSGIGSVTTTAEMGGVAYIAHVGGFLAGFLLTFFFR